MNRLVEKGGNLRRSELLGALQEACEALTAVLNDAETLDELKAHKPLNKNEVSELLEDIQKFNGQFVATESKALRNAGLDDASRSMLLRQATYYRTKSAKGVTAETIPVVADIVQTRDVICGLAAALREPDPTNDKKREVRRRLRKVLFMTGGVATVVIDAAVAAGNPAVATVSAFVGGEIFSRGRKG